MALFAVLVVAVAASCINVGKALQKEGTKKLPRLVLDRKVLATYFQDSTWAAGMALDVCGGLLMVVAISRAPVSLVQPVAAGGVAVLAVFSHFRLGEKLEPRAWAGVAASVVGTVGIGITSEDQPPRSYPPSDTPRRRAHRRHARPPRAPRRTRRPPPRPRRQEDRRPRRRRRRHASSSRHGALASGAAGAPGRDRGRAEEVVAGAQAGTFFSLSALACKIGFIFGSRSGSWLAMALGAAASFALTSAGLVCQTRGLKDGNSVVVCTCGNVAQMVTAVVFGVVVLGERLPSPGGGASHVAHVVDAHPRGGGGHQRREGGGPPGEGPRRRREGTGRVRGAQRTARTRKAPEDDPTGARAQTKGAGR